jgi:hypothetical protein
MYRVALGRCLFLFAARLSFCHAESLSNRSTSIQIVQQSINDQLVQSLNPFLKAKGEDAAFDDQLIMHLIVRIRLNVSGRSSQTPGEADWLAFEQSI